MSQEILEQKLTKLGFTITDKGGFLPPAGMGQMAAQEHYERCLAEAKHEAWLDTRPHWDEQNPWRDTLVYVPLVELAECLIYIGKPFKFPDGEVLNYTIEHALEHWSQVGHEHGNKLDGYILINHVLVQAGVRFGPDGPDYLSPAFSLPKLVKLMNKYANQQRKAS